MNENKCKVISFCNQKGGVAKTTSSVAVSAALTELGKRVLLVDNDGQANATIALGMNQPDNSVPTIGTVIEDYMRTHSVTPGKGIVKTNEGFDLLPADMTYFTVIQRMASVISREYLLKRYLDTVKDSYDYIIIDCPPSLESALANALTASDLVIIPSEPQLLSTYGIEQLLSTISSIQQGPNTNLEVGGILFTKVNCRRNEDKLQKHIVTQEYPNVGVYKTEIPISVKAAEACTRGKSVIAYDSKGKVSEAYRNLLKEIM